MGDVHDVAAVAENEQAPWQAALDIRQPGVDANRLVAERCIEKQIAQARLNAADFNMAQNVYFRSPNPKLLTLYVVDQ